jgi:pimeloyl-ACP methyl ester carboxylesterase
MENTVVDTVEAAPTTKHQSYLHEIESALASRLSRRERRRREFELAFLKRAQFIEINSIVHHYQDIGPRDGEPLILVHGWDCASFWWHHIIDPLAAAGYRVICYDLKGHGFSANDPQQRYTVESFSADLQALADALDLPTHHIAAFSLGAFVALHYAAHHPQRVRSLVFFNFGLLAYNSIASKFVPRVLDFVFNSLLRPVAHREWWLLPLLYSRLAMARNTPLIKDARLGTLSLRCCDPHAVRVSAEQLARREILEAVPRQIATLNQPVLLVAGDGDPIMRPAEGRKLIDQCHTGLYLEVPRCGHLILFELPMQVVQILRMLLRTAGC